MTRPTPETAMPVISKAQEIWGAWTNTDCTEGRGTQMPIAWCQCESTALRLGERKSVQGSTDVDERKAYLINGWWYGPISIIAPTTDDAAKQKAKDARADALRRAKAAGLTDEEIKALRA